MKKVVLSLAVLFAAALVSCGGNKEANAEEATTDTMQTEEQVPAPVDTTAAPADSAAQAPAAAVDTTAKAN